MLSTLTERSTGQEDKRRLILDAAVRVFARKGYHTSRVGDIAEEAGVAHGLLYHYFRSKEELLETIFRETWRDVLDAVRSVEETDESARDRLAGIAKILLRAWRRDPDLVRVLVRDRRKGARLEAWGAVLTEGDVTDPMSLRAAVDGCDTVVHLVAIRQGREERFRRVMVDGTRDLLAAANAVGARRFVHMSALGTTEQTKDLVPYYRAKWDTEQLVKASGIPHVIFRPSFVFGRDGGVLPTFVRLARFAPVTPIIGPGTQRLQPIWIEDLAEYYALALTEQAAANRTFELGGPEAVSWNEFWERLKRVLGVRRPSLHIPFAAMRVQATLTERLPGAPVTRDQLTMLELGDNVVTEPSALETFDVALVPLDEQLRRAT